MVNADEYYGEYLASEDIKQDIEVIIESVEPETVGEEKKLVIRFVGMKKGLVLNVTNKNKMKELFGTSETDNWKGKKIGLTVEETHFGSKPTKGIRIKTIEGA